MQCNTPQQLMVEIFSISLKLLAFGLLNAVSTLHKVRRQNSCLVLAIQYNLRLSNKIRTESKLRKTVAIMFIVRSYI